MRARLLLVAALFITVPATSVAATERWIELQPLLRLPAASAVLVGDRLVVLEPGATTISTYDARSGERRWRSVLPGGAIGDHRMWVRDGHIALWTSAGERVLELSTGATLYTGVTRVGPHCRLETIGESCAMSCECSVRLVDCHTAQPLGEGYEGAWMDLDDVRGEGHSSMCMTSQGGLLVAPAGLAIVLAPIGSKAALLALDARTGAERWRRAALGGRYTATHAGRTGGRCFVFDLDGALDVFECESGRMRWSRPAVKGLGRLARHHVVPTERGLFRYLEGLATLHDPTTGKEIWRTRIRDTWAIPRRTVIADHALRGMSGGTLAVLDDKGRVIARLPFPENATRYDDPGGGAYMSGPDLVAYDADGRERARTHADPPNPSAGQDFVALFSGSRLVVHARSDLRPLADLPGSWGIVSTGPLSDGLLLHHFSSDGKSPGEAVLVRPRPTP